MSGSKGDNNGWVSWPDFIERFDKADARMLRIERAMFVLIVLVASPKLGGPSAPQILSALLSAV